MSDQQLRRGILIAMLAGLACAITTGVLLWWQNRATAAAGARLERNQTGAVISSAGDAINATAASAGNFVAIDRTTRENEDAIENAAGARDRVNHAVRDAGLDSLCRRAAYRGSSRCLQRAPAR